MGDVCATITCSSCGTILNVAEFPAHSIDAGIRTAPEVADVSQPETNETLPFESLPVSSLPVDKSALRMDTSHEQVLTPHSVFELETIGDQGYDDRVIVPGPGLNFGRILRCLIGAGWALVTLQLLAWWVLRADPIGIANHVPSQMAFILPDELRTEMPLADDPAGFPDSGAQEIVASAKDLIVETNPSDVADTKVPQAPRPLTFDPLDQRIETAHQVTANGAVMAEPTAVPNEDLIIAASAASEIETPVLGAAGGGAVPDYISTAARPPRLHPETIFIGNGPRWTDSFEKADVDAAVAASGKENARFDQAILLASGNSAELKRTAQLYYAVTCNLAERATMVNQEGAVDSLNRSRGFFETASTNPKKVRMFANAARNWMNRRLGKGVVLSAKITSIRPVGDLFEIGAQMLDNKRTFVTVITRTNPSDNPWSTFSVSDEVLLGGVIVDDPEVRLPGYLGSDLWVVYATDQFVRLP